jgi:hypothetical protein
VGKLCQKRKNVRGQTVRSGCNGKDFHARILKGFCKDLTEMGQRAVGSGIGLKIRDITVSPVFIGKKLPAGI